MKSILEIVNFFNDDQPYIIAEDQLVFTYANLKKQITWAKVFFSNNQMQKTDTNDQNILASSSPQTPHQYRASQESGMIEVMKAEIFGLVLLLILGRIFPRNIQMKFKLFLFAIVLEVSNILIG